MCLLFAYRDMCIYYTYTAAPSVAGDICGLASPSDVLRGRMVSHFVPFFLQALTRMGFASADACLDVVLGCSSSLL